MRMLDEDSSKALNSVCLYLTPLEAERLKNRLERLLDNPLEHHTHFEDDEYKHELTLTIYREDNLHTFDQRSQRLITRDE